MVSRDGRHRVGHSSREILTAVRERAIGGYREESGVQLEVISELDLLDLQLTGQIQLPASVLYDRHVTLHRSEEPDLLDPDAVVAVERQRPLGVLRSGNSLEGGSGVTDESVARDLASRRHEIPRMLRKLRDLQSAVSGRTFQPADQLPEEVVFRFHVEYSGRNDDLGELVDIHGRDVDEEERFSEGVAFVNRRRGQVLGAHLPLCPVHTSPEHIYLVHAQTVHLQHLAERLFRNFVEGVRMEDPFRLSLDHFEASLLQVLLLLEQEGVFQEGADAFRSEDRVEESQAFGRQRFD